MLLYGVPDPCDVVPLDSAYGEVVEIQLQMLTGSFSFTVGCWRSLAARKANKEMLKVINVSVPSDKGGKELLSAIRTRNLTLVGIEQLLAEFCCHSVPVFQEMKAERLEQS
jgi:hypothetical protein